MIFTLTGNQFKIWSFEKELLGWMDLITDTKERWILKMINKGKKLIGL